MLWSLIDFEAETRRVENTRTLVAIDGPLVVIEKEPKSESGRRALPLPVPVVVALRALETRQIKEKHAAGLDVYTDSG